MLSEGPFWPRAHQDPPPPEGLLAKEYAQRVETVFPDVNVRTRAIAWCLGRALWEGDGPITLISGQGRLGEVG